MEWCLSLMVYKNPWHQRLWIKYIPNETYMFQLEEKFMFCFYAQIACKLFEIIFVRDVQTFTAKTSWKIMLSQFYMYPYLIAIIW